MVVESIHTSHIHSHVKPLVSGSARKRFKDSPEIVSTRSRNASANRWTAIVVTRTCVCADWRCSTKVSSGSVLAVLSAPHHHVTQHKHPPPPAPLPPPPTPPPLPPLLPSPPPSSSPSTTPTTKAVATFCLHVETASSFTVNRNVGQSQPVTVRLIWFPCSSLSERRWNAGVERAKGRTRQTGVL